MFIKSNYIEESIFISYNYWLIDDNLRNSKKYKRSIFDHKYHTKIGILLPIRDGTLIIFPILKSVSKTLSASM